jgi:hypothetical protein
MYFQEMAMTEWRLRHLLKIHSDMLQNHTYNQWEILKFRQRKRKACLPPMPQPKIFENARSGS